MESGWCCRAREIFSDLDLDIAKISLSGGPLALLLGRIIRLGRPRRSPFQPTIPVMRDEGFSLVTLCRSMRVDIVDMWEVDGESMIDDWASVLSTHVQLEEKAATHWSSVRVMVSFTSNNLCLHSCKFGGSGTILRLAICPPFPAPWSGVSKSPCSCCNCDVPS